MKYSKHTPGPWTAEPFLTPGQDHDPLGVYLIEPAFSQLSDLFETLDPEHDLDFDEKVHGENEANAKLISAAPELLDAAKCALADLEGIMPEFEPSGDREHPGWTTIEELKAVIQKATQP